MNIGVIGYGYWGNNLVRNFASNKEFNLVKVADTLPANLEKLIQTYPSVEPALNGRDLLNDSKIDAVAIATPAESHYPLAKLALKLGKHVLVEKPATASLEELYDLCNLSHRNNKTLMIDHTYLYTGAIRKIKTMLEHDELGTINYIDATRLNPGLFRPDINVLWDLAIHDISIINYLLEIPPTGVQAIGTSHTKNGIENIANMTLHYPDNLIAHVNCSWSSPTKVRQMLIGGNKKMVMYDDMEPRNKIKVYNGGLPTSENINTFNIGSDSENSAEYYPNFDDTEALNHVANDFRNAISLGTQPLSDGNFGIEVTRILEAAQYSIKNNGELVPIVL